MKSFNFISLTSFVAITCLRSFSFVGVINKQLKRLTDDEKEVEFYLTILGISQFCGLFYAFLTAFVLDWKPSNKHPDFSLNLAFLLTGAVSILVTSFLLIPVLQLQILSFISYGVMRSFLYSTHGSFVIKEFPLYHTGSLIGATLVFTSLLALVQFLMFALMEGPYNGDPTMVNVGLLVFQVMVMFYPLYLWRRSKEKQSFDAVNFEKIQNQKDLSVGS
ncbi:large neutral amino acids transporter small subunit 4-like isoform X2 [Xenia sp. Carnegie-2017]|uniref:large neutral amino acids transporter small subunit 4-like isoform X2 n=1 Tax=Xenia sp. Carnegie-2017 TaxID=2897299 RepID=UPI001F036537|nr:large neutral amino acids transporter small subunit 4-like isoform X2 [Xenia sp. Carnegie-2017]XP_046861035.1 large neutral amino acids transporter small subunit 4-like isoform X2 [Xenia sp. Carnegie-2017]